MTPSRYGSKKQYITIESSSPRTNVYGAVGSKWKKDEVRMGNGGDWSSSYSYSYSSEEIAKPGFEYRHPCRGISLGPTIKLLPRT